MKCSDLEKRTDSELFSAVMKGTRRLKNIMPLKAASQEGRIKEVGRMSCILPRPFYDHFEPLNIFLTF